MDNKDKFTEAEKENIKIVYEKFNEAVAAYRASMGFTKTGFAKLGYEVKTYEKPLIVMVKKTRVCLPREEVDELYDLIFDIFRSDCQEELFETEEYEEYLAGGEDTDEKKAAYVQKTADEIRRVIDEILKKYL